MFRKIDLAGHAPALDRLRYPTPGYDLPGFGIRPNLHDAAGSRSLRSGWRGRLKRCPTPARPEIPAPTG